jgi:hypothetical protein
MKHEQIEDNATVVRGGRNRPEDIARAIAMHPSGITGISVHAANELPLSTLAEGIPHGQIGVTSVGEIRRLGGDVIRTSGRSPYHATLTGLSPKLISQLLTPTVPNPARSDS